MSGSAAVAIDTPKSPIGRYIRRNAYVSQETAPRSWLVARYVFTNTLIWTAASPSVPGPISRSTSRRSGSLKSTIGR